MPGIAPVLGTLGCSALRALSRRRAAAYRSGVLRLPGLSAPVEVLRDRWGVPHIYARTTTDLTFAQGFVHAQERLWQMDFQRRLVSGRLAEVLGEAALPADRWMRILGMRRAAEAEAAVLAGEIGAYFQSYADGVNAFIARGPLPIEFTLLRYRPEPWTPTDSLTWTKMLAWSLSVNWESELLRAHLISRLGPERALELEPDSSAMGPCIVPPGVDYADIGAQAQEWLAAARPLAGPPAQDGLGSNAWVVAGSRTASGAPILANDLHQMMGAPAIWYENHLDGGDLHATGCSFPGVPGIIAGQNEHVAWGISGGFADVQDLYVEHLRLSPDGRIQYEYQEQWYDARVIRETIRVRGRPAEIQDVIITCHGPIINALAPDLSGEQPLALRWSSYEPETLAVAFHHMNRARNCREFREALRHFGAPCQNLVYADTAGNIGYTYAGRLPIRARGDGRVPVPGWTGEYEWVGYVPFDELPHLHNPDKGYIVTANNRVVDGDYPYHVSCDFCSGDRAARICQMIEARERIDHAYTRRMQSDQVSLGGRVLAQHLGRLPVDEPDLAEVVALLRGWDGEVSADSAAAAVIELYGPNLLRLILAPRIGELAERYLGRGANPILADGSLLGFRAWEWLQHLLSEPDSHWFDLGQGETREEIMRRALRQTADQLAAALGPEPSGWAWGKLHTLHFCHTLSQVQPLDRLYNRGPYPVGGDYTTICATGNTQHNEQHQGAIIGANFLFVADLGDRRRCTSLLVPGQSAHPGSPHYDDQVPHWFEGNAHPTLLARADVEREAQAALYLVPG